MARMPLTERQVHRIATVAIVGLVLVALAGGAVLAGVPGYARDRFVRLAAAAGFKVERVEVTGVDRLDKARVYAIVLDQTDRAMPDLDLPRIRRDLLTYGWIGDARVSRRLPDTLVVDISERVPAAVWRRDGRLSLIDANGVVLQPVDDPHQDGLITVEGPDANQHLGDLAQLLEAAPALKPRLAAAGWVGHRRWDLTFATGQVLMLPEGADIAAATLQKFARMDAVSRLLGRDISRFDMRDPERAYFRLEHPADAAPGAGGTS